jgi:hypothetical protein
MAFETFTIKSKACITLDPNSGSTVKPLFTITPYNKSGYRLIHEYIEVENLKAVSWIYSLAEIEFPVFELEDTESKQLLTAINLEWKSPRIQMDVVIDINNTLSWQRIAAYSLLNSSPYPYREYSLGNHTLGDNSMIGLQIRNVGFGLLQNGVKGQDKITAFADIIRTVTLEKIVDTSVKVANNITTIPATIINGNINRKGLTFFNSSDKNIFIDTVNAVSATSYMIRVEPGDYYEAPSPIYTGNYYAVVASGSTAIDIREFV